MMNEKMPPTPVFKPTPPVTDAATRAAHSEDASKDVDGLAEMQPPADMPKLPRLPGLEGFRPDMASAYNHAKSSDRFGTDGEKAAVKRHVKDSYPGMGSDLPIY